MRSGNSLSCVLGVRPGKRLFKICLSMRGEPYIMAKIKLAKVKRPNEYVVLTVYQNIFAPFVEDHVKGTKTLECSV